jgi:zinc transport system substrate-binding protein
LIFDKLDIDIKRCKKMKKFKLLLVGLVCLFGATGCFGSDDMEDINIKTTTYPLTYLANTIYGSHSTIESIYPNGVDKNTYELTTKQVKEYAKNDLFIYNGLTNERSIAANFINKNKNLKVIDVTKGISLTSSEEELWLYPSNYLMLAQNIKNELLEYVSSTIIKQEIEENYDELKLMVSKYDAEFKMIAENAASKTIIVGNDVFHFLTKYGFNVISLDPDTEGKNLTDAKNALTSNSANYVFTLNTDAENEDVKKLIDAGAKEVKVKSMINLTDEDIKNNVDYKSMMTEFIESVRNEAYN